MNYRFRDKNFIVITTLLLIAAFALSLFINRPFSLADHDGSGGSFWGTIARNYIRLGYLNTRLGMVENAGDITQKEYRYFTHHPPLNAIILSLGLRVLGIHEWSIRLISLTFALGVLALIYLLCIELWGKGIAIFSAIFLLISPMYLHFSTSVDMVTATLFFSLIFIYSYCRWLKNAHLSFLILMAVSFTLAAAVSWEAYYLIPAVLLHNALNKKSAAVFWVSILIGAFSILLYLLHTVLLVGHKAIISNLIWVRYRMGIPQITREPIFLFAYLERISAWILFLFTPAVIILGLFYLYLILRNKRGRARNSKNGILLLLLLFGGLKYLIFINLCYHHPQRLYYLLPFFSITAGISLDFIYRNVLCKLNKLLINLCIISLMLINICYATIPVFMTVTINDAKDDFNFRLTPLSNYDKANKNTLAELILYFNASSSPKDLILTNKWAPQLGFYIDRNIIPGVTSTTRINDILSNKLYRGKRVFFIFNPSGRQDTKLLQSLVDNYKGVNLNRTKGLLVFKVR
jgi:hypothetical protein